MILDEATCITMDEDATSPFTCPDCSNALSHMAEQFLVQSIEGTSIECSCGVDLEVIDVEVKVIPTSTPFLVSEIARNSVWYHSTDVENWDIEILTEQRSRIGGIHDGVMSVPYAHVGTRAAALERFADRKLSSGWLYALRLRDDAVLADLVYEDRSDWDFWVREGFYENRVKCDAIRYINRWESVGSISMLIDPRMMEIVSVSPLEASDFSSKVTKLATAA